VERVEEYLEAIYDIQKAQKRIVKTSDLAKKLNVKPASVTEMLLKLSERNYIEYQPYYGVFLTEKGEEVARRIKRYHRIFETFFKDFLKIDEAEAHRLSCELEHHVTDEVAEKVCGVIASESCKICEECEFKIYRLSEAEPGIYEVMFSPVIATEMGLFPGSILKVNDDGSISIAGEDFQLSTKLSSKIIIERLGNRAIGLPHHL
jgi:DtxR family Mn-dependent transcriptional regulator